MGNDTRRFCIKCGYEFASEQWTKTMGEDRKVIGSIIQAKRGYFITICDKVSEAEHMLKQKEVKAYEAQTGKKGQELADHLAACTTRLRQSWNGKYMDSSASIDVRTAEEKASDQAKHEEMQRQRTAEEQVRNEANRKSWDYMTGREYEVTVITPATDSSWAKLAINGDEKYYTSEEYKSNKHAADALCNVVRMIHEARPELATFRVRVGQDPFVKAAEGEQGWESQSTGQIFKAEPKVVALTWLI